MLEECFFWNSLVFTIISSFIVDGEPCDLSLNITWFLKSADCYNEIYSFKVKNLKIQTFPGT